MKVTVCQLSNTPAQLALDLAALSSHCKEQQSEFLLLPEMALSPWLANNKESESPNSDNAWQVAIDSHAKWIAKFKEMELPSLLSTRPVLTQHNSRRNQAYLWQANRDIVVIHDKYFLPNEPGYWEADWYDMGEGLFDTARVGSARIGVQICTEMWFYEKAREYGKRQVDLLCVPRVTPHASVHKWLAGGQAGAVVSGAYHLSSNLYLPASASADIGGLSWIISPEGDILAQTDTQSPFATVDVDLGLSAAAKSSYPRYVKD